MNTLLIYLILNGVGRWEFLTLERTTALGYCEKLQQDVASAYEARPGNIKIVCSDSRQVEI
ncbi:MAG: hypothetical protein GY844_04230 [Bradyrhizobium sp.]|nr:hypothetical protein [Bradyrhizobium sp.]